MKKIINETESAFMKIKTSGVMMNAFCGLKDGTNNHSHLATSSAEVIYYRNRYGNELTTSGADLVKMVDEKRVI